VNLASTSQGLNAKHLRDIFVKGVHKTVKQTTKKEHNREKPNTSTAETKKDDKKENAIEKQTINNTNQSDEKE
jgi:hypothetical protein